MPRTKNPFKLNKKELKKWKSRLQDAAEVVNKLKPQWEQNINLYQNRTSDGFPESPDLWVDVPKHFPLMELKKHQLFYRIPKVQLEPNPVLKDKFQQQPAIADAISEAVEDVVNRVMSRSMLNLKKDIHKTLFDVLVPGGMGACEIGYRTINRKVTFKAGEVNPLEPTVQTTDELGEPVEQENVLLEDLPLDIPTHEELFWDHFSLKDLLIPKDFKDTDYDKAPWLARRFELSIPEAIAKYKLPSDYRPSGSPEDNKFEVSPAGRGSTVSEVVKGIVVWYKASYFDKNIDNPNFYRKIVFINGIENPVEHMDSPHQELDENGQLTPDSQMGNPIHVLTIRDLTDSAHVPSDSSIITPLVKELSRGRSQMLLHRDRSVPMNWHDRNRVSAQDIAKWEKGIIQASIPVDGDGNSIFGEIRSARLGNENFQFNDIVDRDIRESISMGSNQVGLETAERTSATEASIVDSNAQVRSDGERDRVMDWFLEGLEKKLFPLIQRYGDETFFTSIVGDTGWQLISQWLAQGIPARLAFDILPDSGAHYDSQIRLEQLFKTYEFMAKDPHFNRVPVMRKILSFLDIDPFEAVVDELPEAKPDPPNIAMRTNGDDLNPMSPQFPVVKEVLEQLGIKISEQAVQVGRALNDIQMAMAAEMAVQNPDQQPANTNGSHPGLAPKAELLSKRETTQGQPAEPGMQGMEQ